MPSASNVIRELLVRLGVNVSPTTKQQVRQFDRDIERIKGQMEDAARTAVRFGVAIASATVAGALAVGKLAVDTGQAADEIERSARGIGLTRKEYQEFLFVAQRFGANGRDLADSFLQINEATQRALGGSTEMQQVFRSIGIRIEQLRGLNPGEVFELLAEKVSAATDRQAALAAMSRLLGEESARKLGPALLGGADAIRRLRVEAEELGVVLTDEQLAAAKAVADQWFRLKQAAYGLRNELGAALAPAVAAVLRETLGWVRANRELLSQGITDWVRRLNIAVRLLNDAVRLVGGWDVVFANVATGAGVLLLLANLGKVEKALAAARVAFTAIGVAAEVALGAIGLEAAPAALILGSLLSAIVLVGLAIDDFRVFMQGGNSVLGDNLALIERLVPAFGSVRRLISAVGDLWLAGFRNASRFASAIRDGLAPALTLVDLILAPLLRRFEALAFWWRVVNRFVSTPIDLLTSLARQAEWATTANSIQASGMVRASLAGAVNGQVEQFARYTSGIDNSSRSANVQQVNYFGADRSHYVSDELAGSIRLARQEVQGGPR